MPDGMDSKGSSLPSMPEPAKPVSMKQLPESLSVRSGGAGDLSSNPSLLLDKAAATLQDSVLQKMASHGPDGLRELTSRMLNGEQDTLPKRCAPEQPMPESAEVPSTNSSHQRSSSSSSNNPPQAESPELKATVPQVAQQPCCVNGTSLTTAMEGNVSGGPEKRQDAKTRRGRVHKEKSEAEFSLGTFPRETLEHTEAVDEGTAQVLLFTPSFSYPEKTVSCCDLFTK